MFLIFKLIILIFISNSRYFYRYVPNFQTDNFNLYIELTLNYLDVMVKGKLIQKYLPAGYADCFHKTFFIL